MKKLLITVCLSGLLSVPSVVLGAEMAGASLYGSFRTGLVFGGGEDTAVANFGSRWGIKGSHEVSEGLTASYKYEGTIDTTNAEFGGGNDKILKTANQSGNTDQIGALTSVLDTEAAEEAEDKLKYVSAGGQGGRLSYVSLSGGFGTDYRRSSFGRPVIITTVQHLIPQILKVQLALKVPTFTILETQFPIRQVPAM